VLTPEQIESFVDDGFVALRGAVPPDTVDACRRDVSMQVRGTGVDLEDPATWDRPVVRIVCPETPPFAEAGTRRVLWEAYEQLLAPVPWWHRPGVGGTIAVRFPHPDNPGDAGWHIDGSFAHADDLWVNVVSKARGLLVLFLLSDVTEHDAPTEIKVGSQLDVARLLEPFGEDGASFRTVSAQLPAATFERPSVWATGQAGDVFVCHPFVVHRATWPHTGRVPRAVAQPGVAIEAPLRLHADDPSPVERAVQAGLSAP